MLNHLFHRTILQELSVLVAVHAVIFILRAVGIGPQHIFCERHAATLTKFLFHHILFNVFDGAKIHRMPIPSKFLGYSAQICDEWLN